MKIVTLPFESAERHAAGAVREGVPLESLLAASLIRPRYGDHRDTIGPLQLVLLCMNTVQTLGDATHGLARDGLATAFPSIGLRMVLGSSTLEGAIEALSRLYAMGSNAVHIRLSTEQDTAQIGVHMEARNERDTAYLEENFLVWVFMHCLHFLGRSPRIFGVTLRDPHHFSLGRSHWGIGGGAVGYGDVTAFQFPRRLLSEPPASRAGENVMWEVHQPWLRMVSGTVSMAPPARFVSASGFVRFSDLVQESGKSANTLRRQLQSPNGSFRDARRRILSEAAWHRLRASDDSIDDVAAELGYSDARSFRRFLKAATGLTPKQVRDLHSMWNVEEDRRALQELQALSVKMNV